MPGRLKAKIVAGRHLPVMDRASDLTDAFVEVKFGNTTFKTDVYPKSLNPQWNSEWFKFEVDDEDLQDEPLQITVLDHDTYSANDAIGKVYIDIDPLLCSEAATVISGWLPIYDTIHGIRGEINVLVKVDLFNDLNRFRQSSYHLLLFPPVLFFLSSDDPFPPLSALLCSPSSTSIPRCYRAIMVHGFVEELVVNEDPEYQWIDRIRTPRASNEARQRLIFLMSGELQRKIGLKVLEMGGNAVVGYLQCFDLEGESGLVVRAIGTACTLEKMSTFPATATHPNNSSPSKDMKEPGFGEEAPGVPLSSGPPTPLRAQTFSSFSPSKSYSRQSSSSDTELSLTPKTGVVSARSVKLLDRIHNPDEPETRDAWWEEIRQEIKSHAKALGCHAVVGYSESTSICEEVCILSASGTAAILSSRFMQDGPLDTEHRLSQFEEVVSPGCGFCHIPYDELNIPFPAQLTYCYCCRRYKVPDVLFTTIDLPTEANVTGKGCLIQARLCRTKKKAQGEGNAMAISNLLPFLEYELHTQLMNKLKLRGMNALFGLRIQISVGETMLLGLASATGVYLTALPSPGGIQIAGKTPSDITYEQHISNMQKKINDTITKNKEQYEINPPEVVEEIIGSPIPEPRQRSRLFRSHSESSDEVSEIDLSHGKKDAFVLEIDDTDAVEDIHALLTDSPTPAGNTSAGPLLDSILCLLGYMFTCVLYVYILLSSLQDSTAATLKSCLGFRTGLQLYSLYFKLRSMVPCCLCHLNFTVAIPEDELIQVAVTAVAMSFDKEQTLENGKRSGEKTLIKAITENDEQLQFNLEPCLVSSTPFFLFSLLFLSTPLSFPLALLLSTASSMEKASPLPEGRSRSLRSNRSYSGSSVAVVKMTPLSFIPGAKIIKYLGIINMFFIRETSSLREEGGVSGFLHTFIAEVFAMVRAHVAALGGNAVVSYSMKECVFMENPNKNQAQCLINVSGDAVIFVRESELELTSVQPQSATTQTSNGGEGT
uniref:C2 domain-containing protein 5 n=1 Tax=Cyprinus carpio carpio TaxID=630221 RepID=A0A8C1ASM8_CYPCA